ncbi:Hap3p [Kluyveromyces lactis]|uniref:Transcriptional activator HAP3 n=1 Tax=Kluyveromyces lactis (strain ATCC 8585 / CBS 2359 / DSM 70799 / NBRC 1267 / NRRL Y-1140 / WM37) TaxID=284590 RepID=HAP3_KLULA|nr:uncharacterized protein KLLA0_E10429g [Kluyveromyces lactis]P40914.1 RecName: Full=Transcriptional activator HAP3 [Kluyveromyces lactis NRRL Y-1140]AAC41662.1 Hap3 [Kluyveromyces lactis]CAG99508.1 KLLA0E10429p [Kluyveromyces lactis]|eukprot:XP_454421.1 uncharacterized protein KLLA0_E10429g [Kluyveromyces lactis]
MDTETEAEKQERHNNYLNELAEQDRWLPINNVARLMKNTLPATTKVSKDAKECMQECVSEFISFVTSEACDRCTSGKRKTINGEDILLSLHALGFENYAEVLKIYLAKYRQQQAIKNQMMYPKEDVEGSYTEEESRAEDADHVTQERQQPLHPVPSSASTTTSTEVSASEHVQSSSKSTHNPAQAQPRIVVQQPLGSRHSTADHL